MPPTKKYALHLTFTNDYRPRDPQPDGYVDRADWAQVQLRAGLRQRRCVACKRLGFPQQLADATATRPVCVTCAKGPDA